VIRSRKFPARETFAGTKLELITAYGRRKIEEKRQEETWIGTKGMGNFVLGVQLEINRE